MLEVFSLSIWIGNSSATQRIRLVDAFNFIRHLIFWASANKWNQVWQSQESFENGKRLTITENENAKNNENPFNRKLCDKGRARASNNLRDSWENLFSSLTFGFSVNFHLFYALKCWIGFLDTGAGLFIYSFIYSLVCSYIFLQNQLPKKGCWSLSAYKKLFKILSSIA